jgi:hypothetical protein
MEMQDNEFDKLFRSKLDDFETEPSAGVWPGIASKLEENRRRKILVPFLRIAASIIILVTAGILFIPTKTKVNIKKPHQDKIAKTSQQTIKSGIEKDTSKAIIKSSDAGKSPIALNTANKAVKMHHAKVTDIIYKDGQHEKQQKINATDETLLAATPQKQNDIISNTGPDQPAHITLKQPDNEITSPKVKPVLIATQSPGSTEPDSASLKTKHKVRSLGGFINAMVGKVDKRRDKVIEFTDDDDEESNIIGINLGIIKLKKGNNEQPNHINK